MRDGRLPSAAHGSFHSMGTSIAEGVSEYCVLKLIDGASWTHRFSLHASRHADTIDNALRRVGVRDAARARRLCLESDSSQRHILRRPNQPSAKFRNAPGRGRSHS